jgi:hypothetical protein
LSHTPICWVIHIWCCTKATTWCVAFPCGNLSVCSWTSANTVTSWIISVQVRICGTSYYTLLGGRIAVFCRYTCSSTYECIYVAPEARANWAHCHTSFCGWISKIHNSIHNRASWHTRLTVEIAIELITRSISRARWIASCIIAKGQRIAWTPCNAIFANSIWETRGAGQLACLRYVLCIGNTWTHPYTSQSRAVCKSILTTNAWTCIDTASCVVVGELSNTKNNALCRWQLCPIALSAKLYTSARLQVWKVIVSDATSARSHANIRWIVTVLATRAGTYTY